MLNATVKMHNLQELIRKTYLGGLITNAVIIFKDNRMKIEAIGIEDKEGIIDNTLTIDVNYPCVTVEGAEVGINKLGELLSNLEVFERDDEVQVTTTQTHLIITRTSQPPQSMIFELADPKFVKTYSTGLKVIFGNPIKLLRLDGKEKLIEFDSSVVVDAQKLKDHGSKVDKINVKSIPVLIRNGKLITDVKGETSGLIREVDGITSITGNASTVCRKELLIIVKNGIGIATLRYSDGSPMYIHFEHESMTADYLLQIYEEGV